MTDFEPPAGLTRVLEHLRGLAARRNATLARPPVDQLRVYREVVDDYFAADPACVTVQRGVAVRPIDAAGRRGEWLLPPGADPRRRLLYIHGGGFIAGGIASHRGPASRLGLACGAATLIFEYRLAPEHRFPACLDDCVDVCTWVLANGPDGPAPASSLWLAGDSAGGTLAISTLLRLRGDRRPMPHAAVLLSPLTDLTASGDSIRTRAAVDPIIVPEAPQRAAALYLPPGHDPRDPLASPLFADLHGLPPLLIHVGDAEVMRDDSTRLAERAAAAGVAVELRVWPRMPHVFTGFGPILPEANASIDAVATWLRTSFG